MYEGAYYVVVQWLPRNRLHHQQEEEEEVLEVASSRLQQETGQERPLHHRVLTSAKKCKGK